LHEFYGYLRARFQETHLFPDHGGSNFHLIVRLRVMKKQAVLIAVEKLECLPFNREIRDLQFGANACSQIVPVTRFRRRK
jgi:hypothetical protein